MPTKDKEWSGLLKVPDSEVVKLLRTELGKANAYIQELENTKGDVLKLEKKCKKLLDKCNSLDGLLVNARRRIQDLIISNEALKKQLLP
jgi:t-SNARE complex subunit (syntaxin)